MVKLAASLLPERVNATVSPKVGYNPTGPTPAKLAVGYVVVGGPPAGSTKSPPVPQVRGPAPAKFCKMVSGLANGPTVTPFPKLSVTLPESEADKTTPKGAVKLIFYGGCDKEISLRILGQSIDGKSAMLFRGLCPAMGGNGIKENLGCNR